MQQAVLEEAGGNLTTSVCLITIFISLKHLEFFILVSALPCQIPLTPNHLPPASPFPVDDIVGYCLTGIHIETRVLLGGSRNYAVPKFLCTDLVNKEIAIYVAYKQSINC